MIKLIVIILISMNLADSLNINEQQGKFKIYCFEKASSNKLDLYQYDDSWINFLNNTDVLTASLVLSDKDFEYYNWNEQTLLMSDVGYDKLEKFKKINSGIDHKRFIVSCNDKRQYAGEFLSYMSQMAIKHPVIQYNIESISKEKSLRILPIHGLGSVSEIPSKLLERTASDEIKLYFSHINKLK